MWISDPVLKVRLFQTINAIFAKPESFLYIKMTLSVSLVFKMQFVREVKFFELIRGIGDYIEILQK